MFSGQKHGSSGRRKGRQRRAEVPTLSRRAPRLVMRPWGSPEKSRQDTPGLQQLAPLAARLTPLFPGHSEDHEDGDAWRGGPLFPRPHHGPLAFCSDVSASQHQGGASGDLFRAKANRLSASRQAAPEGASCIAVSPRVEGHSPCGSWVNTVANVLSWRIQPAPIRPMVALLTPIMRAMCLTLSPSALSFAT